MKKRNTKMKTKLGEICNVDWGNTSLTKKSYLEKLENIELLRALDNGMKLKTFIIKGNSFSVDVRKDYIEANKFIKRDKVFKLYKNDI